MLDLYLADPATQAADLTVVRSATDDPITQDYTVARPATIGGVPIGVVVILAGAVLIAAIAVVIGAVRRRRFP